MSTVRLDDKHAKLLDDLKARMTLQGKRISKQEIVGKLIERAIDDNDLLSKESSLEENKADDLVVFDWGVADASSTVDEYLYNLRRKKGDE